MSNPSMNSQQELLERGAASLGLDYMFTRRSGYLSQMVGIQPLALYNETRSRSSHTTLTSSLNSYAIESKVH